MIQLVRQKLKVKACKLQVTILATYSQSERTIQSMVSAHRLNASLMTGITDVAPPISLQVLTFIAVTFSQGRRQEFVMGRRYKTVILIVEYMYDQSPF